MKKFLCAVLVVMCLVGVVWAADEVGPISINDIVLQAHENFLRFNKNYLGKRITVTDAIVVNVDGDQKGYVLTIKTEKVLVPSSNRIDCKFDASKADSLVDLSTGDKVTLSGTYYKQKSSSHATIELVDCELQ